MAEIHPDQKQQVCFLGLTSFASINASQLGAATTSMFFLYYVLYGTSYAKVRSKNKATLLNPDSD
jgi:hypothetical protein